MSFCNEIQHEWFNIFSEVYTDITTDFLPQIFGLEASITYKNDFALDCRSSEEVKYSSS